MATPVKIKLIGQEALFIEWDNGREIKYPLEYLRKESPDAGNRGETILWKHYPAPDKGPDKPGKNEIASINKVGSYAINIVWKDGEDAGIYSWEFLEKLADEIEVLERLPDLTKPHDHKH